LFRRRPTPNAQRPTPDARRLPVGVHMARVGAVVAKATRRPGDGSARVAEREGTTESHGSAAGARAGIAPLSHLPDHQLAEGTVDVRGWEVTTPAFAPVGTVVDLLVDLDAGSVSHLEVCLVDSEHRVRLPIAKTRIDDVLDRVVVEQFAPPAEPPPLPACGRREDDDAPGRCARAADAPPRDTVGTALRVEGE